MGGGGGATNFTSAGNVQDTVQVNVCLVDVNGYYEVWGARRLKERTAQVSEVRQAAVYDTYNLLAARSIPSALRPTNLTELSIS